MRKTERIALLEALHEAENILGGIQRQSENAHAAAVELHRRLSRRLRQTLTALNKPPILKELTDADLDKRTP